MTLNEALAALNLTKTKNHPVTGAKAPQYRWWVIDSEGGVLGLYNSLSLWALVQDLRGGGAI